MSIASDQIRSHSGAPALRPPISFELFPPRTPERAAQVYDAVSQLAELDPAFFSVTYGASGSSRDASAELVDHILTVTSTPAIAHLTCADATRAEIADLVRRHLRAGVRDFLALRGDPPAGQSSWSRPPGGLDRAVELVELIREVEAELAGELDIDLNETLPGETVGPLYIQAASSASPPVASTPSSPFAPTAAPPGAPTSASSEASQDVSARHDRSSGRADTARVAAGSLETRRRATSRVSVSVAAYPGGQVDSHGAPIVSATDIAALAEKQQAGADFAITQVFFSARHYSTFVARARQLGIMIPIVPGIIPLTDLTRLRRLEQLTGVPVPPTLVAMLESAPDAESHYQRGLGATVGLINEVLAAGAPGLHLYTFNNPAAAIDLLRSARLIDTA